jgi:hypothetical protein
MLLAFISDRITLFPRRGVYRRLRTLSDKSAGLVADALLAMLVSGTTEDVAAFFVPVGAATLTLLLSRTHSKPEDPLALAQQLANPLCRASTASAAPPVQASAQIAQRLALTCSLTQLLTLLEKVITTKIDACGQANWTSVLDLIEACQPVLRGVRALAGCSTAAEGGTVVSEIDAAGAVFSSCSRSAPQAPGIDCEASNRTVALLQIVSAAMPVPGPEAPEAARWLEKCLLAPAAQQIR